MKYHTTEIAERLAIAVVWDIPVACSRSSTDFMISSTLMYAPYDRLLPDHGAYRERLAGKAER